MLWIKVIIAIGVVVAIIIVKITTTIMPFYIMTNVLIYNPSNQ